MDQQRARNTLFLLLIIFSAVYNPTYASAVNKPKQTKQLPCQQEITQM